VSAGCELHFEAPRVSTIGWSITETALPKAANAEQVQFCVRAEDKYVHRKRLDSDHAIERIAMIGDEPPGSKRAVGLDWQQSIAGVLHGFEARSGELARKSAHDLPND
jgi:hypothetical protein